jgi:hypothetical protein
VTAGNASAEELAPTVPTRATLRPAGASRRIRLQKKDAIESVRPSSLFE